MNIEIDFPVYMPHEAFFYIIYEVLLK